MQRILRLPDIKALTGLSRSSIYAFIKQNKFPAPVKLGERAVGWHSADIQGWLDSRGDTAA